jgi:serine/threonine protein kinase
LFSADAQRLRRFEQEARATAALNHPNVVAVFDVGTQNGSTYMVSELLEGKTLRAVMQDNPMPVRLAMEYAVQIVCGLDAAHEKGIVHRDLKPDNIFITRDGRAKILDFGLAKLALPKRAPELGIGGSDARFDDGARDDPGHSGVYGARASPGAGC